MGIFSGIMSRGKSILGDLTDTMSRFNDKPYLKAVVAVSYVVAAADGTIDADEKGKMRTFIERNLPSFKTSDILVEFKDLSDEYEFDVDTGNDKALKLIAAQRDNPERVHSLMRLACVIGKADGSFDDDEKEAARKIGRVLGADLNAYGL